MNEARVAVDDVSVFRWQALAWATAQQTHEDGFVLLLNNNGIAYPNDPFPNRLFVGAKRVIRFRAGMRFRRCTTRTSKNRRIWQAILGTI